MTRDVKAFGKVAVLMGGWSGEREVSLMSGQGVLDALLSKGVDAHRFDPKEQDIWSLKQLGISRCFIALHGAYGEDGVIQGALEVLGIPYTGSGVMASAISMDKVMTKRIWLADALPTPAYEIVRASEVNEAVLAGIVNKLKLPLIVKPAHEGSSIGVTKVLKADMLKAAIDDASRFDGHVLCEQFIEGDEVTCAVIGSGKAAQALPVIRIVAPEGNYDYEHKYFKDDTKYECPASLPQGETEVLQQLAVQAYQVLECRGWGRVDAMIDRHTRKPYLLEVNTSPGMTSHSLVPMAARATGLSYADLCVQLLADATLDVSVRR